MLGSAQAESNVGLRSAVGAIALGIVSLATVGCLGGFSKFSAGGGLVLWQQNITQRDNVLPYLDLSYLATYRATVLPGEGLGFVSLSWDVSGTGFLAEAAPGSVRGWPNLRLDIGAWMHPSGNDDRGLSMGLRAGVLWPMNGSSRVGETRALSVA